MSKKYDNEDRNIVILIIIFLLLLSSLYIYKLLNPVVNNKADEEVFMEYELLNEEFQDYPKIIVMDKNIKKGVKEILEDETIKQDPVIVMQFLVNNKGDVKETIKNLKSMNSNKIIL